MEIHPTAIVSKDAVLGENVHIAPFAIIEAEVEIGDNCHIGPHSVIKQWTIIGNDCRIAAGAVLGEQPQDRKYRGEKTWLRIGDRNEIREYVTLHRASGEGNATVVGNDNMIMAYCHAGHNAKIGNNISITNGVQIGGHAVIEDRAILGAMIGVHQFATVGTMAMLGGMSRVTRDVPPYSIVEGNPTEVHGVNVIGLERNNISPSGRTALRKAFRLLFRSPHNISDALIVIEEEVELTPEVKYLCDFMRRVDAGYMGRQLCSH